MERVRLLTPQEWPLRSQQGDICRIIMPLPNHKWLIENEGNKEQLTVSAVDFEQIGTASE